MKFRHANRTSFLPVYRAVQALCAAAAAMPMAHAADSETAELTQAKSAFEVGIAVPSAASAKANEYSGVAGKDPYALIQFDLRRNSPYDSADTQRVRIFGGNTGPYGRSLVLDVSDQGRWRAVLSYDQLRRQRSDSYQSPYFGAGTNVLTLPGTWRTPLVPRLSTAAPAAGSNGGTNARGLSSDVTASNGLVSGVSTAPTAAQLATAAAIQAADVPAFHAVDLQTTRSALGMAFTGQFDRNWQVQAGIRHEDKTGMKPMSTVTRYTNGDLATVIPDLIDQLHEQLSFGVQYADAQGALSLRYYGSLFTNRVPSMSWASWAVTSNIQTMSTAPSNSYHQLVLSGNYALGGTTRLSAQVSRAHGSQNETFLTSSSTPIVPVPSLNGEVVTTSASVRLVARPMRTLGLTAAYRFDDRDNRTAVHTYGFYDAGEAASGTSAFSSYFPGVALGSNVNLNANRPYSRRLHQANFDADYSPARGHTVKLGAEWQQVDRRCPGSWIACVDADKTTENTLSAEWRFLARADLQARLGLASSRRTVDYNENAFLAVVPMANFAPVGSPGGATAYQTMLALGVTGYGPVSGLNPLPAAGTAAAFFFANNNALANSLYANQNRISELPGMRRYSMADRQRDKLRSMLSWQANEETSVQAKLDYNDDRYGHSVYGLQKARGWTAGLDGTYEPTETFSLTAYLTAEDQKSRSAGNSYTANSTAANVNGFTTIVGGCYATIALRNASNKVDPCLNWQVDMRDKVNTLGVAARARGLAGGKLDVSVDASLSQARSDLDASGGNYVNNPLAVTGAPAGTVAASFIAAAPMPTVKTDITDIRLGLRYALSAEDQLGVGWRWQSMKAVDWAYDGMQFGGLAGVLPSLEQAPRYHVQTVMLSYRRDFR